MNGRLFLLLCASALGLAGIAGCRNCCTPSGYVASAPPCCDPAPGRLRPFHALTPRRYDVLPGPVPPTRTDILGPPAVGVPGVPAVPAVPAPPPAPPADIRGYGPPPVPPPEPTWRPSPDASRSPAPDAKEPARLLPPESSEPPPAPTKPEATRPERPPSPPLPVGIPQFTTARNRVASGLKPSLEGLDWLQQNSYSTVLNIRRPGEDDAADRRQVEKRGLKYVSLEVSPQTLTRELVDQFNHLVGDVSCLPLFVYDKDGALQGALWYLHFRIVDLASDEEARIRAGRLGLKDDGSPEQRELWLAIQKLLSGRQGKE